MTKSLMLTGASGLVGSRLARSLRGSGWAIRGLSRSSRPADSSRDPEVGEQRWFEWDGCAPPGDALRAATAVVHLAGEAIFGGLPTRARREAIAASRIDSTRAIVDALGALPPEERPECLLCASATGFYGDRGEDELREDAAAGPFLDAGGHLSALVQVPAGYSHGRPRSREGLSHSLAKALAAPRHQGSAAFQVEKFPY